MARLQYMLYIIYSQQSLYLHKIVAITDIEEGVYYYFCFRISRESYGRHNAALSELKCAYGILL